MTVTIFRKKRFVGFSRKLEINIGGQTVSLLNGASATVDVPAGTYLIKAQLGAMASEDVSFTIRESEQKKCYVYAPSVLAPLTLFCAVMTALAVAKDNFETRFNITGAWKLVLSCLFFSLAYLFSVYLKHKSLIIEMEN